MAKLDLIILCIYIAEYETKYTCKTKLQERKVLIKRSTNGDHGDLLLVEACDK